VEQAPSGFPVDFAMHFQNYQSGPTYQYTSDRLTAGKSLVTNSNAAEVSEVQVWDSMDGVSLNNQGNTYPRLQPMWRRAPGFFDVVCYEGNKPANTLINHNLQVAPEFMIVKNRTADNGSWVVQHSGLTNGIGQGASSTSYCYLNSANGEDASEAFNFAPTSTTFTLASQNSQINDTVSPIRQYIAYLFASVPGICDIGTYTGQLHAQTIDCGFTNGARLVLIKRTDGSGDWYMTTGPDLTQTVSLNTTAPAVDSYYCYPSPGGFTLNSAGIDKNANIDGATYIYMAIA
jgi:hypothetical protein